MNRRSVTNIGASIRQKLLNKARESSRPFNEILQYYAIERFLYRLSVSPFVDQFILKGALMFSVWQAPHSRPTMDIDMLGFTGNDMDAIADITRQVSQQPVEPDGLNLDVRSVTAERIKEDADYQGVRVRMRGELARARVALQVDIGFGDVITPKPAQIDYPTILPLPAPRLRGYNRETVVAEKFQAMVELGQLNSRMKDFYDIWLLLRQFDFDGETLAEAVKKTFANRDTQIPERPLAFSKAFGEDHQKQIQWKAFIRKSKLENAPHDFADVTCRIQGFLQPVIDALLNETSFRQQWRAGGQWD